MRRLKAMGFTMRGWRNWRCARPMTRGMSELQARGGGIVHEAMRAMTGGVTEAEVRKHRLKLGIRPVYKRIDSCAAEFDASTPYLYSTYEAPLFGGRRTRPRSASDARSSSSAAGRTGSGRGSSSILLLPCRFRAGASAGFETMMVNCNPETVSTDPDTSDRLYFEPLSPKTCWKSSSREAEKGELSA